MSERPSVQRRRSGLASSSAAYRGGPIFNIPTPIGTIVIWTTIAFFLSMTFPSPTGPGPLVEDFSLVPVEFLARLENGAILYAIVPVIRLTDLGIRLVDKDVIEAANAFGLTAWQKLTRVELPLALPNIMAGVNQTIMMSLAMVVIASLVSAPGLGVLVLGGIRMLALGVGLVAGLGIVLLAVILDRASKAALARVNVTHENR